METNWNQNKQQPEQNGSKQNQNWNQNRQKMEQNGSKMERKWYGTGYGNGQIFRQNKSKRKQNREQREKRDAVYSGFGALPGGVFCALACPLHAWS